MKKELENIAMQTVLGGAAVSIIARISMGDEWFKYAAAATCLTAGVASVVEFNGRNRFITPVILALSCAGTGYIGTGRWEVAIGGGLAGLAVSQAPRIPGIARFFKQA